MGRENGPMKVEERSLGRVRSGKGPPERVIFPGEDKRGDRETGT